MTIIKFKSALMISVSTPAIILSSYSSIAYKYILFSHFSMIETLGKSGPWKPNLRAQVQKITNFRAVQKMGNCITHQYFKSPQWACMAAARRDFRGGKQNNASASPARLRTSYTVSIASAFVDLQNTGSSYQNNQCFKFSATTCLIILLNPNPKKAST